MDIANQNLSPKNFDRLRSLVYTECGISLNREKKTMLEVRVRRRLRTLNLSSYTEYCDYVLGPHGREAELIHLIDVVTTNKTDFFREPDHFEFLISKALPDLESHRGI